MQLNDLLQAFERMKTENSRRPMKVVIPVVRPGTLGGTPCVEVKQVAAGFDWDAGKVMLYPEHELTTLTAEDVIAIRESVAKGQSWHAYRELQGVMTQRNDLVEVLQKALLMLDESLLRDTFGSDWVDEAKDAIAKAQK